jgi:hypothetical protein
MKQLSAILILSLILFSCKKEESGTVTPNPTPSPTTAEKIYDTIYPGPWFPAFPGSWWTYQSTKTGKTIIHKTELSYVKNSYSRGYRESPGSTSAHYVPYYDDGGGVWGYSFNSGKKGPTVITLDAGYVLEQFFSETQAEGENVGSYPQPFFLENGHLAIHQVFAKDTTVFVSGKQYDSVIVISLQDLGPQYYDSTAIRNKSISKKYYAKGIGIIRKETFVNDTLSDAEDLIDYFINH